MQSLCGSNGSSKVWPMTLNIWPWGQKLKISLSLSFAYGPSVHSYAFLTLLDEKCGRSSRKYEKSAKNAIFRCDLDLSQMTLGLVWYVDLAYAYLPCIYDQPILSLRGSNVIPKVWPWISDLEGKNSKFRRIPFLRMVILHIPMRF